MTPAPLNPESLVEMLPPGGLTYVQGCSGHSAALTAAVMRTGDALGRMVFTGIFVPGLNRATWLANPSCTVRSFFMTPELRQAGAAVTLLPFCYADILRYLRTTPIDAAIFTVAPPDANGVCSFGPVADFLAELWPKIPVRLAHINPLMPRTRGQPGIPLREITGCIERKEELPGFAASGTDAVAEAIGAHVAQFVADGMTLQTGLGRIPDAVLRALTARRGLRIHSGLVGDGVLALLAAGALAKGTPIVAGVAIGSAELYAAIASGRFEFRPVSYTHSAETLGRIRGFVTINSAFEVDLFGQAYAELGPDGLTSGPGGASDFARGAGAGGGLRIVVLASSAARGETSRVVAPRDARGPVSLGRMDTDVIVTEHGAADLRGLDHHLRARAIIAIAPMSHRDELVESWRGIAAKF